MKPSTELFNLIKSLSKSEKRFFKLSSSLQSGDKNYLKIFDYIEEQNEYDEEMLKTHFKGERFVKHLPSEKNHLYRTILKSLRSFYGDHTVSGILKQEIKNIELLHGKALYKECSKFVSRAKKMALEYEQFYYLNELISWEKQLLEEAYEEGEFNNNLDEIIREEEEVIAKLRNLAEYQVLYSKINFIFRSEGFTKNEAEKKMVDAIADHPLIKGKNTALSTRAATVCYYVKGLCSATNRDYASSYGFFNRVREILDRSNLLEDDLGKRYVLTLSHLLQCYIDSRNYSVAFSTIEEIRALEGRKGFESTDIRLRIFATCSIHELMLLNSLGSFQQSMLLIPSYQKKFKEDDYKMSKEQKITFSYQIAYAYFGLGEYKTALQHINEVLNDNEQTLRQDVYTYARLFNLIIHYELENYDYLSYIIKSTNRFINKTKRNFEIENYFIKQLKKLSKEGSHTKKKAIFKQMKSDMAKLFENSQEKIMLNYFDVASWVDAKVVDIPFSEAIKQNTKIENQR